MRCLLLAIGILVGVGCGSRVVSCFAWHVVVVVVVVGGAANMAVIVVVV